MSFLIYFALILIIPIWAQSKVKSTYKNTQKYRHHPLCPEQKSHERY